MSYCTEEASERLRFDAYRLLANHEIGLSQSNWLNLIQANLGVTPAMALELINNIVRDKEAESHIGVSGAKIYIQVYHPPSTCLDMRYHDDVILAQWKNEPVRTEAITDIIESKVIHIPTVWVAPGNIDDITITYDPPSKPENNEPDPLTHPALRMAHYLCDTDAEKLGLELKVYEGNTTGKKNTHVIFETTGTNGLSGLIDLHVVGDISLEQLNVLRVCLVRALEVAKGLKLAKEK